MVDLGGGYRKTVASLFKILVMKIRRTREDDVDRVMEIFEVARSYMRRVGNPSQWGTAHPPRSFVESDIVLGQSYVVEGEEGELLATFALIYGEDPTYERVCGGSWPTLSQYATIHRIASSGRARGMGDLCFSWAIEQCRVKGYNLRFDTHHDNRGMQAIAERFGFVYCGVIYLVGGDGRFAYHLEVSSE